MKDEQRGDAILLARPYSVCYNCKLVDLPTAITITKDSGYGGIAPATNFTSLAMSLSDLIKGVE